MPSSTSGAPAPLTFDTFWRWLQEHRTCIIRCGAGEAALYDHESLHWDFFDEGDGQVVCQAILGKSLVGELVIDRAQVLFVQASADVEDPTRGYWLFECIGGPREESYPLFHFLLSHGMESVQGHQVLKH